MPIDRLRLIAVYRDILPMEDIPERGRRTVRIYQDKVTRATVVRTTYHDSTIWEAYLAESHLLFKGETVTMHREMEALYESMDEYVVDNLLRMLEKQMVKHHD